MGLYTIFAWTAVVIAGGAYYWVYIRGQPLPTHLLSLTSSPSQEQIPISEDDVTSGSQKRKRKASGSSKRSRGSNANELATSASALVIVESEDSNVKQAPKSESRGPKCTLSAPCLAL